MLLGAGQADDSRGMSWGGRCGMINADLYRHKRQPSRTSECHKLGPQQSCSRRPDTAENRAMPSATHRVLSLWLVAVGKAGRGQVGLCLNRVAHQGHIPKDGSDMAEDEGLLGLQSAGHFQTP